jgi:hypothetical protein
MAGAASIVADAVAVARTILAESSEAHPKRVA